MVERKIRQTILLWSGLLICKKDRTILAGTPQKSSTDPKKYQNIYVGPCVSKKEILVGAFKRKVTRQTISLEPLVCVKKEEKRRKKKE